MQQQQPQQPPQPPPQRRYRVARALELEVDCVGVTPWVAAGRSWNSKGRVTKAEIN